MHVESSRPKIEQNKLLKVAAVAAMALGLSGCAQAAKTPEYTATPNMTSFLKPGDSEHCFNGGERPCALLLRTEPKLSSEVINAIPTQVRVDWPLESYGGKQGDALAIRCYKTGDVIKSYENDLTSADWYQVVVPAEHVANLTLEAQTVEVDGKKALLGWASVTWFNRNAADPSVPVC